MQCLTEQIDMKPLKIYLADLTYTTLSLATDAFPLNIGFIAAYANKTFGKKIQLTLFKYIRGPGAGDQSPTT